MSDDVKKPSGQPGEGEERLHDDPGYDPETEEPGYAQEPRETEEQLQDDPGYDPQTESAEEAQDDPGYNPEAEEPAFAKEPGDSGGSGGEEPPSGGDSGESAEPDEEEEPVGEMTFLQHLDEFRNRVVRCIAAIGVGFVGCYAFSEDIFNILMEPMVNVLQKSTFIYTYPPEAFFTYIKVSLVAGFFAVSPYVFYQIWRFVAPGLYARERKYMVPIAFFTALFFVSGALFGYFVVFPFGFEFFASFSTETIEFTPKLSEYLSFALKLLFAFGIVFEMPIFVFFLATLGLVSSRGMRKYRKYAILLSFVASALLTPPDPFTQLLMSGPLIIMYEASVIVAAVFGPKPKPAPEEEPDDEEAAQA
jgi:sec-independent protein translocase protein TatC